MLDELVFGCLEPSFFPPMHAWHAALQAENLAIDWSVAGGKFLPKASKKISEIVAQAKLKYGK